MFCTAEKNTKNPAERSFLPLQRAIGSIGIPVHDQMKIAVRCIH
jgi:hypothetical protein